MGFGVRKRELEFSCERVGCDLQPATSPPEPLSLHLKGGWGWELKVDENCRAQPLPPKGWEAPPALLMSLALFPKPPDQLLAELSTGWTSPLETQNETTALASKTLSQTECKWRQPSLPSTQNGLRLKYESYSYKSIKFLKENTEANYHNLGNGFLDTTPKAQATKKKKIDRLDFLKIKIFSVSGIHPGNDLSWRGYFFAIILFR